MVIVTGLHLDAEEAAVDAFGLAFFIMDTGHVAAAVGNDAGDVLELPGFIDELNEQAGRTAGLAQTAVDDTGKAGHVNVAAGNDADDAFALAASQFAGKDLDIMSSTVALRNLCYVHILHQGKGLEGLIWLQDIVYGQRSSNKDTALRIFNKAKSIGIGKTIS